MSIEIRMFIFTWRYLSDSVMRHMKKWFWKEFTYFLDRQIERANLKRASLHLERHLTELKID